MASCCVFNKKKREAQQQQHALIYVRAPSVQDGAGVMRVFFSLSLSRYTDSLLVCCCCLLLLLNFYCCTQKGSFHLVHTHTLLLLLVFHQSSSRHLSFSLAPAAPKTYSFPPPALRAPVNVRGKLWTMRWTSAATNTSSSSSFLDCFFLFFPSTLQ